MPVSNPPLRSAPHFRATVTKEIVASSTARNSNHCMIAEAVKAAKPKLSRISVDVQTIRATDKKKGERYIWLTPRSVQHAIIDFDLGKEIKPFKFGLTAGGQTVAVRRHNEHHKEYMREQYHKRKKAAKASLRNVNKAQNKPRIIGGREPPKSIGARREYGLKALQA